MNEFFPLLKKAMFGKETDIPEEHVEKQDVYLMNRYASFCSPDFAEIVNSVMNKQDFSSITEEQMYFYQVFNSILPKEREHFVPYYKKKNVKCSKEDSDFVKKYSRANNVSEQKVFEMLYVLKNLENNE